MIANILGIIAVFVVVYTISGFFLFMFYDDNKYTIEGSKPLSILFRIGCLLAPLSVIFIIIVGIFYALCKLLKWFFKCQK